jgi:hypothetical protein
MATATPPACIILNPNSICGRLYNGYPVLQSTFSDQAAVDSFIKLNVISSSNVEQAFTSSFGCTAGDPLTKAIANRRYHTSYQCSKNVDDAITRGCTFDTEKFPASGPVLCSDNCQSAVSSLRAIFNSESACPASVSESIQSSRDALVTRFTSYCSSANETASTQNGLCASGAQVDKVNCGFSSKATAEIGCKLNSLDGDECCTAVIAALPSTIASDNAGLAISIEGIVAIVLSAAFFATLLIVILFVKRKKRSSAQPSFGGDPYLKYDKTSQERLTPDPYYGENYDSTSTFSKQRLPSLPPTTHKREDLYSSTKAYKLSAPPAMPLPSTTITRKEPAAPSRQPPAPVDSKVMIAIHPYYPALADELRMEVGDEVLLLKAFDGMCLNILTTKTAGD